MEQDEAGNTISLCNNAPIKTGLLTMSKRRISETISPSPDPSPAAVSPAAAASAPAPKRRRMRRQHHRQYLSVDPPSPEDYYHASPTTTTTPVSPTIPPAPSSPPPLPLPPRTTPRYRQILPKPAFTSTSTPKPPTHSPHPHPQPQPQPPKGKNPKSETRKTKIHPHLPPILHHLRTPLHPLVSSTTGHEHPDFPLSLLQYHLLTSDQLDRLAVHFHQVHPPVRGSFWYPVRIVPWLRWDGGKGRYVDMDIGEGVGVGLEVKRRRFGRFIGLRGWRKGRGRRREVEVGMEVEEGEIREEDVGVDEEEEEEEEETAEEMLARMEREWFEAMMRARYEGEYAMRWKMGRG
ncbi:hypothetical protein BO83DRAFT_458721 [Aspergillus eucalypticola CBS 122712]|uniref:Uncharacterized protein n=1 Tax=Aspergillus eucalypticola (strain CBS 122712 / IBT 29274) TaxID=1448314 RepID=A0A317UMQ0_ASPEC|nr:uncharacterized protein BO83DRAFT_458721 [Aspergillus eucalypticola CBS 122712]PWY62428.1 hypothetical protein BO83DRAFT_458721 [Aspergillus eucalypticola CBS 122712]